MSADVALRCAYAFNIIVLGPVLFGLYAHRGDGVVAAIGGGIHNVDGLRLLVGALWSAVLIVSVVALYQPKTFVTLLLFQVIYKAIYLATYVAPIAVDRGWAAVPSGPAIVFIVIVCSYPFAILLAWKSW